MSSSTPPPTPSITPNILGSNLTFEYVGSSLINTYDTGCTTGAKFQGAVLGLDRNFYLIPDEARYITKFDPGTKEDANNKDLVQNSKIKMFNTEVQGLMNTKGKIFFNN